MRRVGPALVVVALLLGACGTGTGRTRQLREVSNAVEEVRAESRTFEYSEELLSPKQRIEVRGTIQDDLRSRALLSIDGVPVLEQVISDDAIAMRVRNQDKAARFIVAVRRESKEAADALTAGKWVVDHQGAPEIVAQRTSEGTMEVGTNPMLDATVYSLQYFGEAIREGQGMEEWNPDAVAYNPLDDPWKEDADLNLVDEGVRRYDIVQPGLPRPTQRGTRGALPGTRHFRKMAFYLKGQDLISVREQILIADRPEFRRAAAGRAAEYYTTLMRQATAGITRDPVRQRRMVYEISDTDEASVTLPSSNVVTVEPIALADNVSVLFPERRGERPALPGLPGAPPATTDVPAPATSPDAP